MTEEKHYSNPAGRLCLLLEDVRKKPNQGLQKAWSAALGIEGADVSTFLDRYSKVLRLPDQIRRRSAEAGLDEESLWFLPEIESSLNNVRLDAAWKTLSVAINEERLMALRGHSTHLAKFAPEPTIELEKLRQIREQAQHLFDQVFEDETLEYDLKQFLLDSLGEILLGIQNYWVTGTAPIRDALEQVIGAADLDREATQEATTSRHWPAFREIVVTVCLVLQLTNAALALTDRILPQLPGTIEEVAVATDSEAPD